VRPDPELVWRFIDQHRDRFAVAVICRALSSACQVPVGSRGYYAWRSRGPSRRALWEIAVTELLAGIYAPDQDGRCRPESLYGSRKTWAYLQAQGVPVARCTVERLMRSHGWRGIVRGRVPRTTISDPAAARAGDLVERHFKAEAPNQLLVADFTYVRTRVGFVYTAFVIDAYAGLIPGWQVSNHPDADLVVRALDDAVETRAQQGHPITPGAIHHSDAGRQYTAVALSTRLGQLGMRGSIGSVGDAYDNALAEATNALYKSECIQPRPGTRSPFHTGLNDRRDVEHATAAWVHWYNHDRLMHRLDLRPPLQAEAQFYAEHTLDQPAEAT
jgi:putative transposase